VSVPHLLIPYARTYEGFVLASWEGRAPVGSPGHHRKPLNDRKVMHAYLRRPDVRVVMAVHADDTDVPLGWCAVEANSALLWLYVRDLHGKVRRRGLGCALLLEAGLDPSQPTPCRHWSPYATMLAQRGYRLIYAPKHERTAACA
jgi:hypothetical protein